MRKKNTRNAHGVGSIFPKKVKINGKMTKVWDVRKRYPKLDGKGRPLRDDNKQILYRTKTVRCYSEQEAYSKLASLDTIVAEEEAEEVQIREIENREKTFFELCDYFEKEKIVSPVYVGNRKVAGYTQNHKTLKTDLAEFREFFGDIPLSQITYNNIVIFANRLAGSSNKNYKKEVKAISAATINKKLGYLRRVLNVAVEELDWLAKSPFKRGAKLIHKSAEEVRSRIMSFEEEAKILAEAEKPHRHHVKFFVILAVDTAMRRSEIYKLQWWQVDLENRVIYLTKEAAKFSKTGAEGILPMTDRVYEMLSGMRKARPKDLVIGEIDFKKAWNAILADAGISDLQFRDCRATACVRMISAGVPEAFVKKITRHSKDTDIFFKHYTRIDEANAREVGAKLSVFNRSRSA